MDIMMNKIILFAILATFFVLGSCGSGGEGAANPSWDAESPLYKVYEGTFLLGNIIRSPDAADLGGVRFNILKRHFNAATAENHMKPDYIAPSSKGGAYKWDSADKIVDAANAAGLKMHGHTLVWHEQTPSWMTSDGDQMANLKKYVTDVVTRYKGKVVSWDVVNEAMKENSDISGSDAADWKKCLRDSPWNKAGTTYIEEAFRAARLADPSARLFYNDYNLNGENKSKATYNMVKDINARNSNVAGRPLIDGIGMQTHHHLNTNPATVKAAIELFASLGVEIAISEMDIVAADGGGISMGYGAWNESNAQKQAVLYAKMFDIFKDNAKHITRVTFWGLDDGTSWRSKNYPLLLDANFGLKPAFFAVQDPSQYIE
jgi:endo-1,4-beta-xylanase